MSQNSVKTKQSQKTIVILLGVIIGGIIFRLIFSHFELPLNSDNLQYFLYALDFSLGESTNSIKIHNPGWPLFLSFFFTLFESNNYMDFMALQKIISISISSLTAIPIYFLGKKFFSKDLAIIGSILFVFEPRIVQNSTFGISDPLYVIALTIAIVLLVNSRRNFEFLAFSILGLSIIVRSEGLFLIPAFILIYFWQKKISKNSIIKIIISLLIISTILSTVIYFQNMENTNRDLFSRIDSGIDEIYSSPETKSAGSSTNLIINGVVNFIKFLGWSQIPIWVIFVPIGFIFLLISKNQDTKIILTLLFFISLPTLYAFSFVNDTRYLFPLYPIFSLLSLFFLTKFSKNKKNFSFIKMGIIIGLILSSTMYLIWKDIDVENEQEAYDFMKKISDDKKIINYFGYELSYRIPTALEKVGYFPISTNKIEEKAIKVVNIPRVNSFEEFIKMGIENKMTHLAIKEKNHHEFLDEIFKNEKKYPFLIKENDFREQDSKVNLKIFKIDYNKYDIQK